MYMLSAYLKSIALAIVLTLVAFSLGACGNTVKGIGTDIVTMGDKLMKEETKNEVSKQNCTIGCSECFCVVGLFGNTRQSDAGHYRSSQRDL